jgi:SAM-dependent methyltransferase
VAFQDHFSSRAQLYARARPTYPHALFADLAALVPDPRLAWDCGTGNGQAAVLLAAHFDAVVATDPSAAQLTQVEPHPRVSYRMAAEDGSGIASRTVDLVTAAQAAHWFDSKRFYTEVRRVLRPGGVCAVWCYGLCRIEPEIDRRVSTFYSTTVGSHWPADRRYVDDGYRSLAFPLPELPFPAHAMRHEWHLEEFGAYLRSWSAVARYQQAHDTDPVAPFLDALAAEWGTGARTVTFPLTGRVGRIA